MRAAIWSVVAMLTLGALGLLWFLSTHTRVSERAPVWPQAAARQNPYLAASELLRQYQLSTRQVPTLEGALALQPGSVLLVSARRGLLSARAVARLRAATEAGAHLVVEAEIADERDPLLDAFGIERIEGEYPFRYGSRDWTSRLESDPEDAEELVDVPWDQDAPLRVHLEQTVRLKSAAAPEWSLGVESDIRALHLQVGQGQLTVVSDLGFLSNWGIGRNDHAEFFWQLIHRGGDPREVVFLQVQTQGLWSWLLRNAWPVLLTLALGIVCALWALAPRMGAIRPDPEPMRRRLLDHLRASGRLLWQQGAREELLQATRRGVETRLLAEYPHLASWTAAQRAEFLQTRFKLPRAQARALCEAATAAEIPAFLSLIRAARGVHLQLAQRQRAHHDPLYEPTE